MCGLLYDECERREKVPQPGHLRRHDGIVEVEAVFEEARSVYCT